MKRIRIFASGSSEIVGDRDGIHLGPSAAVDIHALDTAKIKGGRDAIHVAGAATLSQSLGLRQAIPEEMFERLVDNIRASEAAKVANPMGRAAEESGLMAFVKDQGIASLTLIAQLAQWWTSL